MAWWCRSAGTAIQASVVPVRCGREQICCNEYEEICETIHVDSILPKQRRSKAQWAVGAEEPVPSAGGRTFSFKVVPHRDVAGAWKDLDNLEGLGPLPAPDSGKDEDSSTHEPNIEDASAASEASPAPEADAAPESPNRSAEFRLPLRQNLQSLARPKPAPLDEEPTWSPLSPSPEVTTEEYERRLEQVQRYVDAHRINPGSPDWKAQVTLWQQAQQEEERQSQVEELRQRLEEAAEQRRQQEEAAKRFEEEVLQKKREYDEAVQRLREAEAEHRQQQEEDARRRAEEEAEQKRRQEEQALRIEEEVAERIQQRVEEETRRLAQEAQRRQRELEEEQRRLAAMEAERQRILEEEAKRHVALELEAQRREVEEGERQRQRLLRRLCCRDKPLSVATKAASGRP